MRPSTSRPTRHRGSCIWWTTCRGHATERCYGARCSPGTRARRRPRDRRLVDDVVPAVPHARAVGGLVVLVGFDPLVRATAKAPGTGADRRALARVATPGTGADRRTRRGADEAADQAAGGRLRGRSARGLARQLAAIGLVATQVRRIGVVVGVDRRRVPAVLRARGQAESCGEGQGDRTLPHRVLLLDRCNTTRVSELR